MTSNLGPKRRASSLVHASTSLSLSSPSPYKEEEEEDEEEDEETEEDADTLLRLSLFFFSPSLLSVLPSLRLPVKSPSILSLTTLSFSVARILSLIHI